MGKKNNSAKSQRRESNQLKLVNVKDVCGEAYLQATNDSLSVADSTCKASINGLSHANKNRFCLDTKQKIEDLLRRESANEEILVHAVDVLKRFCDANTLTRAQNICARRGLAVMTELLHEKERTNNRRCEKAIDSLSHENKQKFCSNRNSLKVIKKICDAFIDDINAATNYRCIAPYLDAMWYPVSEDGFDGLMPYADLENHLRQSDSNCKEAVEKLWGENKERFCRDFEKTIPEEGSPLVSRSEGPLVDGNIRARAINVVKGVCSNLFRSREKREIDSAIKEIEMENARNGITEAFANLTSLPNITLSGNMSIRNITHSTPPDCTLTSLKSTSQADLCRSVYMPMVAGATVAALAGICAFWTIKSYKNSNANSKNPSTEKDPLLREHHTYK